jgi:rhodanese-related sulfurtransferase
MSWLARNSVSVTEAAAALETGASLVDVRTDAEWASGRAAGARHVPLTEITRHTERLNGAPVLVICRSGSRSSRAAAALRRAGVDAKNVRGGMLSWERSGLPVDRAAAKTKRTRTRRNR